MKIGEHVLPQDLKKDYPVIVGGKGVYLYDEGGERYIDASSGPILASLGYGIEEFAETLKEQCLKVNFAYRGYCQTPELKKATEYISEISDGVLDKSMIVSGGTEAVELAVKLARTYHIDNGKPSKYKIIGRWLSYHGMSSTTLSVAGHLERRKPYKPYLSEMGHIPPAYCYRCWLGKNHHTCNLECAEALEQEILVQGPEEVAAFIAEPVSGNSICAAYPQKKGYFERVLEICRKYDVLFICDEVMTGIGRTGAWFGYQQFNIEPDIVTMGKALGGGYFPVGAVGCTENIAKTIKEKSGFFFAGYSWTNNPMAAAVIIKTIEYKKKYNLLDDVQKMGQYLKCKLEGMMERHNSIGDVRGIGLMWGIEFVKDKETKEPFAKNQNFVGMLVDECVRSKLFVQSGTGNIMGHGGDMLFLGPAFTVKKHEIDEIVEIIEAALSEVEEKHVGKRT